MKMKLFTAMLLGLFALSACNNDNELGEVTPPTETKSFSPQIIASTEQAPLTRAGVIEENDYTQGEQFYWSVNDATTVSIGTEALKYTVTEVGEKPNQATFATEDILSESGTYNVMGYFPTSAWTLGTRTATIPAMQEQTDKTSKHLGAHMLMIAKSDGVAMDDENPISLHYKHLASVFRFVVTNRSAINDLKLTNISMNVKSSLGATKKVFGTEGSLADKDATSLTIDETSKESSIGLNLTAGAQSFVEGKNEGYMVVLPVSAASFDADDEMTVDFTVTDGPKTHIVTKSGKISELAFLTKGIEQGTSYYIRHEIKDEDISIKYSVGDYYPDPDVVYENNVLKSGEAATGIVFWLDQPIGGKSHKGKIVGLKISKLPWCTLSPRLENVYSSSGKENLEKIKTRTSWNSYYHAFRWCADQGTDWYLPSLLEAVRLTAGYAGTSTDIIGIWEPEGRMPDNNKAEYVAARDAFDAKLVAAGGQKLIVDKSYYYWTSSEKDKSCAWRISFSTGNIQTFFGKSDNANTFVRAVRDI